MQRWNTLLLEKQLHNPENCQRKLVLTLKSYLLLSTCELHIINMPIYIFYTQCVLQVDCGRSKLTWVTHMIALPNVNKMMLAFTDNMLALYDLSTANCERLMQIVGLPHCVLNMEYW